MVAATRFIAHFFSCVAVLITVLWLGALPFYRRVVSTARSWSHELIRIPRSFIGPCRLEVVALYSCSTEAFGHRYFGRGCSYRMNLGFLPRAVVCGLYYWCLPFCIEQCRVSLFSCRSLALSSSSRLRAASGIRVSATPLFSKEPHEPWGFTKAIFSSTPYWVPWCIIWSGCSSSSVRCLHILLHAGSSAQRSAVALVLPLHVQSLWLGFASCVVVLRSSSQSWRAWALSQLVSAAQQYQSLYSCLVSS